MTTANKVTVVRILFIPFFIAMFLYYRETGREGYRLAAFLSFAAAAISDGIDGYIARRYRQRSELGAVLDPLADKLLLVSGLVLLSLPNEPHLIRIPIWLAAIVFGRDLILALGAWVIHSFCGRVKVKPHMLGKVATVLQMSVIVWALLKWKEAWLFWIMVAAGVTTAISGVLYLLDGMKQLAESPHSAASESDNDDG